MKKNRVLYIIAIIVFIFLVVLTIYKITKYDNPKNNSIDLIHESYSYELNDFVDNKSLKNNTDAYHEHVIKDDIKHYEYEFKYKGSYKYGYIEIDENNHIVIYDEQNKVSKIFNDDSFKSLYIPNYDDEKSIKVVYALTNNGNIYYIIMPDGDVEEIKAYKMNRTYKVLNFLDLTEYTMFDFKSNNIVVLNENNEIYDFNLDIPYNEKNTIIGSDYIIYADGSISTYDGKIFEDLNTTKYYIKSVLNVFDDNFKDTDIIFITTDNHLIFVKEDKLYVYNSLVKNVEQTNYSNCKISFENNKFIEIKCSFDENRYNLSKNN